MQWGNHPIYRRLPETDADPSLGSVPLRIVFRPVSFRRAYDVTPQKRKQNRKCLEASLKLQSRLRRRTHPVLAAQEDERTRSSRELRDEIAPTLLGINVRRVLLRQKARNNTKGLKNEIARISDWW